MTNAIATLIAMILPPGCNCSREGSVCIIKCSSYGTARGVWERRFDAIYPLLEKGDILEVVGDEFHAKSYPKPPSSESDA